MKMKAALILCAVSLMAMTGCGEKEDQPVAVVDVEKTDLDMIQAPSPETEIPETENTSPESIETLEGTVKSIEDASVVISKTFVSEEDGVMLAWGPAEGSEDEVLITVNFSENTKYELHTVKNSGVNGDSDVTKSEASFSDIKEDASITLSGYFITPDEEYMADSVIIYNFV